MHLNQKNLESKRRALHEAHSPRAISDYEKLKNNLDENLKRQCKILDEKYKSEGSGGIQLASLALEKEKIETKCKLAAKEGQHKFNKRVETAVENEIKQLQKRRDEIIKNEKTTHNFFPSEWGPSEIGYS
ncbi:hypothetical protein [Rickettsiella endosymbiont of Rhagonycha lignosa]|uniref:hypothetical protein n=1 Tax=Rickettsiella endosymbiont of Rhagonycha lignosa TaxID=3077937 RepID=UPI00313B8D55